MAILAIGALHVVETTPDNDAVAKRLKQIDPRLFVERQITLSNEEVWCVCCDVGSECPPVPLIEHRDELGKPIPFLSHSLVERVQKMERDGGKLSRRIIQANADRIERRRKEAHDHWRDMTLEALPSILGRRSVNLPRGQYLRMSRDKMRRMGLKV